MCLLWHNDLWRWCHSLNVISSIEIVSHSHQVMAHSSRTHEVQRLLHSPVFHYGSCRAVLQSLCLQLDVRYELNISFAGPMMWSEGFWAWSWQAMWVLRLLRGPRPVCFRFRGLPRPECSRVRVFLILTPRVNACPEVSFCSVCRRRSSSWSESSWWRKSDSTNMTTVRPEWRVRSRQRTRGEWPAGPVLLDSALTEKLEGVLMIYSGFNRGSKR